MNGELRQALPSGTVTFLFTDIEASAERWERSRDAMSEAVRRHDELMRAVIAGRGGSVFKTVGDAFCAVFPTAPEAVAAALDAQGALAAADWSAVGGLRVRMALHTGSAEERDGDYFGPTVNRVARLLAIGHGGQVLVSGVAADLSQGLLPPLVALRDLGAHRLRDLAFPEQVYQLTGDRLAADFPPLRSLDTFRHNLPQQLTSFVGRDEELAQIREMLERTRLVSLVGTGGVGKTRTALHVAADLLERFPDGVWLVELAPLRDLGAIEAVLISVLGLASMAGGTPRQAIVGALRGKHTLLIFDNCEHVVREIATLVEALLVACPGLRVLASSREGLAIGGETIFRIPSLAVPPDGAPLSAEEARRYGAVTLFEERAATHQRDFALTDENAPVVAELCRRLDGIALAIELATPRLRFLSPKALLERLEERFRLLTGGRRNAIPRQQTMRALIDWSYDLLAEPERQLFRRVAVFVGGWTLEGATAVCSDDALVEWDVVDLLGALVDKSLVAVELGDADQRFRMLESTRQYAREKLEGSAEAGRFARAHAEWVAARMEAFEERYWTSALLPAVRAAAPELDNVRAAFGWALMQGNDPALGARIAASALAVFSELGLNVEAHRWAAAARDGAPSDDEALQGRLLIASNDALGTLSQSRSLRELQVACDMLRRSADRQLPTALLMLAMRLWRGGHIEEGRAVAEEALALARAGGERVALGLALRTSAVIGFEQQSEDENRAGIARLEEALRIFRALGDDARMANVLTYLGELAVVHDPVRAAAYGREALGVLRRMGAMDNDRFANALSNTAQYLLAGGEVEEAIALARESLALAQSTNLPQSRFFALIPLALGVALRGNEQSAARLLGFLDARVVALDVPLDPPERLMRRRIVEALDTGLGPGAYENLLAEGAELPERDAIAEALAATAPLHTVATR
ncbi:MAG: ATP-binding protein [Vulcanimicrobiaceae bacterium]